MSHSLSEAQWIDRFLNRFSALVPSATPREATLHATFAYSHDAGANPEIAAANRAREISEDAERGNAPTAESLGPVQLALTVPGATEDQLRRGLAAAEAVFIAAAVTYGEAAVAIFKRDDWDDAFGLAPERAPTQAEFAAASVWEKAEVAAFAACGVQWDEVPEGAHIHLVGA